MPQSLGQKTVNNFVKGLITEAAELTFPEGASVDELNCDLRRDGTRRRRLGVALESEYGRNTGVLTGSARVNVGTWINVGGNPDKEFRVLRIGYKIYFENPATDGRQTFSFTLPTSVVGGGYDSNNYDVQFASLDGYLIVSNPATYTYRIKYDALSNSIFTYAIKPKIRDFEILTEDKESLLVGSDDFGFSRTYDAFNSGWAEKNNGRTDQNALDYYHSTTNKTPPLTTPWFAGKSANNEQDTTELNKIGGGNSFNGNGHYIIDFLYQARSDVSEDDFTYAGSPFTHSTFYNKSLSAQFACVAAFSGRVFYAGISAEGNSGKILFTKIIESESDFEVCYQVNDPTSEYLSDLLDTDGGVINIPDAVNIQKLFSYQNSLFVFAENGVWQISGIDGYFKATGYAVSRVCRVGLLNPSSFVSVENVPFWWSESGIHTLQSDPVSGQGEEQNISISTIQTFFDNINNDAKSRVRSVYDAVNKRIIWAYPDNDEPIQNKLSNFLILDIPLQAFYPWRVADAPLNEYHIVDMYFYSGFGTTVETFDVKTGNDDVVNSDSDQIVVNLESAYTTGDPSIVLMVRGSTDDEHFIASFSSSTFLDWGTVNYSSYVETGYDFVGDLTLKKTAPYLTVYARLTEEGFTGNDVDGYEVTRPSSLLVSTAWDFRKNFGTTQQAYKFNSPIVVDPENLDEFPYPNTVVTNRLKIRGKGRSVRMRYESEEGKDFILLGWAMVQGRNPSF